jgi:predicted phosphoribosyltransferase
MFRDREDAAGQLAEKLRQHMFKNPLVLAIPRGGVVTGAVLARKIGGELDVVLSRKLRAPDQPEFAIGAISETGEVYVNEEAAEAAGVTDEYFHQEKEYQLSVIAARKERLRGAHPKASIQGRTVIVTDDGIATGSTMMAALQTVRSQQPAELIVAVPVAPADRIKALEENCDKVVCLLPARHFWAVGQFYEDFPTVEDDQVLAILKEFGRQKESSTAPRAPVHPPQKPLTQEHSS